MSSRADTSLLCAALLAVLGACGEAPRSSAPTPTSASAPSSAKGTGVRRLEPPKGIESNALAVGAQVPKVLLASSLSGDFSLQDTLNSGEVVLVFYRGVWWPYCRKQLGELQTSHEEFKKRQVALVGLSVDPIDKVKELSQKLELSFPLLSDPDLSVIKAFGLEDAENGISWPAIYIVGRDGKILWRSLAETYKERPAAALILDALPSPK